MGDHNGGFGLPLLDTLSEAWGSGRAADAWVWFEVLPRIVIRPDRAPTQGDEAGHDQLLDVRMLVDSVREHALLALDPAGNVTNWGTVAEEMTGYSAPEFLGRPVFDLFVPPSARAFERDCAAAGTEGWHEVERWLKRKDGTQFWADVALAPIVDRSGTLRGLSALISDATERKQTESERERLIADLRDLAMTDELTGLPNRRRWDDELNRDLARSRRHDTPLAVAMLDLNDFKAFNDTQGHPAGDLILQGVAREWSEAVRATDMLARYGGDEFAITLPDCPPALALTVIGRVQAATPNGIASSAGIASSDGVETADQLVARADAALYDAKRNGESVAVATNA
jgi:diguanylate cyclase (GGDEF)-like protein/PAS domain S-box-containing protein